MRKLASIEQIGEVRKHPNADSLDLVMVNGWQIITRLDEFKLGDRVAYFEIDSFLPVKPEYEFLRKSCFRSTQHLGDGFRLRAIKLRGEMSFGLVLPLDAVGIFDPNMPIGTDLTDVLEVKKWEPAAPAHLQGDQKGYFPLFIKKTDQERVQNCFAVMERLQEQLGEPIEWHVEEKMNGSSCTVYYHKGEVGVCSHNFELNIEGENAASNTFVMTAIASGYLEGLKRLGCEIAVQAELCGPGIQKNPYKLAKHTLVVFDVWLIEEDRYVDREERDAILDKLLMQGVDVHRVPYLGQQVFFKYLNECLSSADGPSLVNPQSIREGIVLKSVKPINGQIISFKAVSNKFLLKEKE